MLAGMSAALSGVRTFSRRVSVAGHNVANVATPGFKASRLIMADVGPGGMGLAQSAADQAGLGVQPVGLYRQMTYGGAQRTGRPFDLSIAGNGFFMVSRGGEPFVTRTGAFGPDSQGYLIDANGNRLQPPIQIPANARAVNIEPNGQVTVVGPGGTTTVIGQIQLAHFPNPEGLNAVGGNLFRATAAAGDPLIGVPGSGGLGAIGQGFLESSNVDLATEMVDMMVAQHGFAANIKVLEVGDDLLGTIIDVVR